MVREWAVREGQRYLQRPSTHNRHVIWQVGAIKTSNAPVPHARLINVDDPLSSKTISFATLANPGFYELLLEPAGTAAQT